MKGVAGIYRNYKNPCKICGCVTFYESSMKCYGCVKRSNAEKSRRTMLQRDPSLPVKPLEYVRKDNFKRIEQIIMEGVDYG